MTTSEIRASISDVQKRYVSMALISGIICGGGLVAMGFAPLGKGLLAGTLFSVLNFWLMARALPSRLGHGRARTFFLSITSIYGRYALMALPLILAVKLPYLAVSTVAIGLFAVPLVIVGERIWQQWRRSHEVGF